MVATVVTQCLARRLVARRLYPVIIGVVLVAGAVVTGLAADYSPESFSARIDRAMDDRMVAHFGGHVGLVRGLSDLGGAAPVLLATLGLTIVMLVLGRARGALLAVLAPSIATVLTDAILKPSIGHIDVGQAYPSGHATAFCSVAFAVVVLALDQRPPRAPRSVQVVACGAALALVGCVAGALVAAQFHFASDVIGGVCVALGTVLMVALGIDGVADRRTKRPITG